VVTDGARIAVQALAAGGRVVGTPGLPVAGIGGTRIGIVTDAGHSRGRFINFTVAVVVHAVAYFLSRTGGIARGQLVILTSPLPVANAPFVLNDAGRCEGALHRVCRAVAGPFLPEALGGQQAIYGGDLAALVSCGTVAVSRAGRTAKMAFVAIADTGGTQPGKLLAIAAFIARQTQRGEQAGADEHNIRIRSCKLAAFKPLGALFNARLGAHLLPLMEDTIS